MLHVPRRDPRERSHAERIAAGDAAPVPGIALQALQERQRGRPDTEEFLDMGRPRTIIWLRFADADVLIERRQFSRKAAREPEPAEHEDPLRVIDVTQHFADAPLVRRITVE